MKVEREIAGFSLPFAAGTAISAYAADSSYGLCIHGVTPALMSAMLLTALLFRLPSRSCLQDLTTAALGFCLGVFCSFSASITAISGNVSSLASKAEGLGLAMREACSSVPFASETTNTIVKALITGDRSGMPAAITETFRKSGASHILALSGLHLGIIYMIVSRILLPAGKQRSAAIIRSLATISICGIYTFATGAGPSISRALLFIILRETAAITGRSGDAASVFHSALMLQLSISPLSVMSVGFQLSYAAMAGITFIYPRLKHLWPDPEGTAPASPIRKIWDSAALSISCQLTTAPLACFYFGSFPVHFMLTNLIAMPLTGLIIPSAVATVLLNEAGACPDLLVRWTELLIRALSGSLSVISGM